MKFLIVLLSMFLYLESTYASLRCYYAINVCDPKANSCNTTKSRTYQSVKNPDECINKAMLDLNKNPACSYNPRSYVDENSGGIQIIRDCDPNKPPIDTTIVKVRGRCGSFEPYGNKFPKECPGYESEPTTTRPTYRPIKPSEE